MPRPSRSRVLTALDRGFTRIERVFSAIEGVLALVEIIQGVVEVVVRLIEIVVRLVRFVLSGSRFTHRVAQRLFGLVQAGPQSRLAGRYRAVEAPVGTVRLHGVAARRGPFTRALGIAVGSEAGVADIATGG